MYKDWVIKKGKRGEREKEDSHGKVACRGMEEMGRDGKRLKRMKDGGMKREGSKRKVIGKSWKR